MNLLFLADQQTRTLILNRALRQSSGVVVRRCTRLQEACQLLAETPPDAILLLEPLPDGDAVDLWQFLRQRGLRLPVVVAHGADPERATLLVPTRTKRAISGMGEIDDETPVIFDPAENAAASSLKELLDQVSIPLRPESKSILQAQLLGTLLEIAPLLLTEFDLDALLQRIVEKAVELIPQAEAGSLQMLEKGRFIFRGMVGYPEEIREVHLPADHYFIPALQRGEVIHVRHLGEQDALLLPEEIAQKLQKFGHSRETEETLAAPFLRDGELFGYLTVDSFTRGATFGPADEESLRLFASLAGIAIRNAELFQAEHEARSLAEALGNIQALLNSTLNLDQVLDHLLSALSDFISCDAAEVLLVEGDDVRIARWRGDPPFSGPAGIERVRFSLLRTSNLLEAARERAPVLLDDVHTLPGWIQISGYEWIRAHIAMPLFLDQTLVGFLNVMSSQVAAFKDADLDIMKALTPPAALAIRNARLFHAEQSARRLAETLQEVGAALVTTFDEMHMLRMGADYLRRILPFNSLSISFLRGEEVWTPYTQDLPADLERWLLGKIPLDRVPLWREMAWSRRGVVISDTGVDPRWEKMPDVFPEGSFIGVPLRGQGKVMGFVCLSMPAPYFYGERDLQPFQSLADLLAMALTNARLFWEARQARHRAEEAYESLRRLDAMKSQFTQNVSHELRTPLSVVKGYVDLALDGTLGFTLDPALQQVLQTIQVQTSHLVQLVESITVLEDLEIEQITLRPQPILPVLLASAQAVRQRAQRESRTLTMELPPQLPEVALDPQHLGLALAHLLDNAMKFTVPGGRIWLWAAVRNDELWIQIQDDGIGIPAEELERIFERFYQVDGSVSRRYGGLGLGLSIVREIILKHQGRVWAESEGLNQGTIFHIVLPIYRKGDPL